MIKYKAEILERVGYNVREKNIILFTFSLKVLEISYSWVVAQVLHTSSLPLFQVRNRIIP